MDDMQAMRLAIEEAKKALEMKEMPVGCVIVKDGEVIARAHNERERLQDPSAHAEMLAIRQAAQVLQSWRLEKCTLYVTLEPCPMCAGAIAISRIPRLVYGAADEKYGCAGSVYRIPEDPAFMHFCKSEGGLLKEECQELIRGFFEQIRD